jgi:DNA-directed RNA polymerase sigma subunit (sigma70/sigma32)
MVARRVEQRLHLVQLQPAATRPRRLQPPPDKPKTLEEIGRRLGLTRERIRQIEVEALRRLASLREIQALPH